jgi:predicted dehydrogenase/threonine dehydrogenase-like Zn-dependent dehydrogenase
MKQLLQNVSSGELTIEDVPVPERGSRSLLVATSFSLISAGTERAVLEMGQASLIGKARARPDLARQVLDSARVEGIGATYAKVRGRLAEPNALGYSSSGEVVEACPDAPAAPGELVACAGAGLASHAEMVSVPRNLCARVPEGVPAEDAAYATVAAIALHGVRLARVQLGDVVAVVGMGLVGQLTVQLLVAAGCVVLGCDPDAKRALLARDAGVFATTDARELEAEARRLTGGRGADAVLITAASRSSAPLEAAMAAARSRAKLVIVGDVSIESARAPLFSKELNLVVSRSYGPGRYDPAYESQGVDYPADYVRWTEGRNLDEVLRLMASGALRPSRLTTHVFDVMEGSAAYELLESSEPSLGILLRYSRPIGDRTGNTIEVTRSARRIRPVRRSRIRIGVVGAGAFARGVLLPQLVRHGDVVAVATSTGVSARASATRFGASMATTDAREVFANEAVDAVVIATRHGTHSEYVAQALRAGKHVFVEKPLALNDPGLANVEDAVSSSDRILMVGFNRRFAPMAVKLKAALAARGPLVITYRVNAGRLPRSHWTHDLKDGGGRIVGEVCHFVDFAMFLTGCAPTGVSASAVGGGSEPRDDSVAATLRFPDGSVAVITYSALGDPGLPKERVELMGEAGAGILEDFTELSIYRNGLLERQTGHRDKGHRDEVKVFMESCRSGHQPWPTQDMAAAMRATFAIRDATLLSLNR